MKNSNCVNCGSAVMTDFLKGGKDYEYGVPGEFNMMMCAECGLVFMNPRPGLEEIISFYPETYHGYRRPKGTVFSILAKMRWNKRYKLYRKLIGAKGRILDVGCGEGEVLKEMGRRGYEMVGVEFKKEVAERGRKNALNVLYGTLESVDLPKNHFDVIIMNHLIEHLDNPHQTLQKAFELLRPGGLLVGETPSLETVEYRIFGKRWGGFHFPRHLQIYTESTLRDTLSRNGFKDIRFLLPKHPGQLAKSMENWITDVIYPFNRRNGKTGLYGALLLLALPIVLLETLLIKKAGIVDFVAKKM